MPKVLIIEDDTTLRSAYDTVLKKEGYETATASDGAEGLDEADKSSPDVILLDMLMPNLHGLDFLKAYDLKGKNKGTKVVVFSNMSAPSDVKDAIELGATKYLTKSSFTPKEVVMLVKEVLSTGT